MTSTTQAEISYARNVASELSDRGSIEVFLNDGEVSSTRYVLPPSEGLALESSGEAVRIHSMSLHALASIWPLEP